MNQFRQQLTIFDGLNEKEKLKENDHRQPGLRNDDAGQSEWYYHSDPNTGRSRCWMLAGLACAPGSGAPLTNLQTVASPESSVFVRLTRRISGISLCGFEISAWTHPEDPSPAVGDVNARALW